MIFHLRLEKDEEGRLEARVQDEKAGLNGWLCRYNLQFILRNYNDLII